MSSQRLGTSDIVAHNRAALAELTRAITLRPHRFSLVLARCNYSRLQRLMVDHLQTAALIERPLVERSLPTHVPTLLQALALDPDARPPAALMVTGLEQVQNATAVFKAANLGRNAFPQALPFPVVLWVSDRALALLNRHAPDFKSFAAAPISFEYPPGELIDSLHANANDLFATMLSLGDSSPHPTEAADYQPGSALRTELEFALADIAQTHTTLDGELKASLDFLKGRDAFSRSDLDVARYHFEQSLTYWQKAHRPPQSENRKSKIEDSPEQPAHSPIQNFSSGDAARRQSQSEGLTKFKIQNSPEQSEASPSHPLTPYPLTPPPPTPRQKQAVLLFYLGATCRSQAILQRVVYDRLLHKAESYFTACLRIFRDLGQPDLVGKFIHALAEVQQKLGVWPALERTAQEGLTLHRQDPVRLARNHGYLAEVALAQGDAATAQTNAERALTILAIAGAVTANANEEPTPAAPALGVANQYQRGWYLYLLGRVHIVQNQPEAATTLLEAAYTDTDPKTDLPLYRSILQTLQQQYYQQKKYRAAFGVKLKQRQVDTRFKLRAFIGAGEIQPQELPLGLAEGSTQALLATEIQASGRQADVDALTDRLEQARYPLIIIHGPSGVGKSSTLYAGLVPALAKSFPEGRSTLAALVRGYRDWPDEVNQALARALQQQSEADGDGIPPAAPIDQTDLSDRLQRLTEQSYRQIVLIFDQFEEFFVDAAEVTQRRDFYAFLLDCLNTPYLKVVLSLREDYLHHLLEIERGFDLDILNNDILSRDYRYYLGNFKATDAKFLIRRLTDDAHFYLETALIDQLVADLSTPIGEVRPIELQVVGAQLQRQEISTLEDYLDLGDHPKETLVQNFLGTVVDDCGAENADLARLVLYLLTDIDRESRPYRPQKSRDDIEEELNLRGAIYQPDQLDLVLDILVGSGLVFLLPDIPIDRYQLVHDYLVSYARREPPARLLTKLRHSRGRR
ncbi:ATP-binding protein [Nodosilinea sp. PGN35]|uniref:ATP-binding protein n=1 Tax=Nodosilinea sp. PGN35 TaxID=3020489 RepID=UPI0023B2C940|nr:ATP-binding protein [Nodosilinea sp. TSF1-S3]MDF0367006.1 ATP-binding protein [Nodosilinea sp. TSF1-S3]